MKMLGEEVIHPPWPRALFPLYKAGLAGVGEALIPMVCLEPGTGPTEFCIWPILSDPAWVAHRDCVFYFALLGVEGETF